MEFEHLRPILSGLAGSAIAFWLGVKLKNFLPLANRPGAQRRLSDTYAATNRCANVLFSLGLAFPLYMYFWGGAASNDWRPLALGWGGAALGTLLLMLAAPLVVQNGKPAGAFRAYAVAQKAPVFIHLPFMLVSASLFPVAIAYLYS